MYDSFVTSLIFLNESWQMFKTVVSSCLSLCLRSIRTNSFFAKFPKLPLGQLIMLIYFWSVDLSCKKTSQMLAIANNLVCKVFHALEDICSTDLATNPFLPFPVGGTAVVKCDESKFNHKAKVNSKLAEFK